MKKKILFRADGNASMGLGHLYRLFALVEVLKEHYEYLFLTKENSAVTAIPKSYNLALLPEDLDIQKEASWIAQRYPPSQHLLIADGYHFNSVYQQEVKKVGYSLVYIDDLAKEHMFADIVVNHSPGLTDTAYHSEAYTQYALGVSFAILRPAFLKAASEPAISKKIDTAFVCFGGADSLDLSLKAAKALNSIPQIQKIHLVLGAAYKNSNIYKFVKGKDHISIHKGLDEKQLIALMRSSGLAIAPSSTIVYELCTVKLPVLSGYYVENQKGIYAALAKQKAIFEAGDLGKLSIEDMEQQIRDIISHQNIEKYLEAQQRLFDGRSGKRLLGLINSLNISFRNAAKEDVMLVYKWSNDPLVRKNSYSSAAISLADHKQWYLERITSASTYFYIVEVNGIAAGLVRYEVKEEHAVVGISIAGEYRGQGLAAPFLKESAKKYFKENKQPIFAYIKKQNRASVKSFEKAGYIYYKDQVVAEQDSLVYKKEA